MERAIEQICSELNALAREVVDSDAFLERCVDFFSTAFGVTAEEVAIFALDNEKSILHFVVPEKLRKVGFIPLSSLDSLAARTAREVDVFLENTFASQRHTSFFEKIRLGEGAQPAPKPIQKIISAPILGHEQVRGVIQISRKGVSGDLSIPDFTDHDAELLVELARILGTRL